MYLICTIKQMGGANRKKKLYVYLNIQINNKVHFMLKSVELKKICDHKNPNNQFLGDFIKTPNMGFYSNDTKEQLWVILKIFTYLLKIAILCVQTKSILLIYRILFHFKNPFVLINPYKVLLMPVGTFIFKSVLKYQFECRLMLNVF